MGITDKIFLSVIYAAFCGGVITVLRYFPHNVRLRKSDFDVREQFKTQKAKYTERIKGSRLMTGMRNEKVDRAIYEDLSYLRNLIIAHKGMVNSDAVISSLAEKNGALKKTYVKMLSLMRTGRVREAEVCMCEDTGTEMGKEFASLLTGWEHIAPEMLEEIIVSYRKSIREICLTRQKKREEVISDFIYFPATMNVFLIFINFVYISYFMEQKEMFNMIF